MTALFTRRIVRVVSMIQILDALPDGIAQRPGRIWNVLARSLGEQGAGGRTALAWRWALTGSCPSPVTLSAPAGSPPDRAGILAEAAAAAEMAGDGADPGGQVLHARLVLQWLAGDVDAVPLWSAGPPDPQVTDGAAFGQSRAEIEETYGWTLAARLRYPWPGESAPDGAWLGFGWAFGAMQLLAWVCGEAGEGPVSGTRVTVRPTLYQVSLDVRRAMTAFLHAREDGSLPGPAAWKRSWRASCGWRGGARCLRSTGTVTARSRTARNARLPAAAARPGCACAGNARRAGVLAAPMTVRKAFRPLMSAAASAPARRPLRDAR